MVSVAVCCGAAAAATAGGELAAAMVVAVAVGAVVAGVDAGVESNAAVAVGTGVWFCGAIARGVVKFDDAVAAGAIFRFAKIVGVVDADAVAVGAVPGKERMPFLTKLG